MKTSLIQFLRCPNTGKKDFKVFGVQVEKNSGADNRRNVPQVEEVIYLNSDNRKLLGTKANIAPHSRSPIFARTLVAVA